MRGEEMESVQWVQEECMRSGWGGEKKGSESGLGTSV